MRVLHMPVNTASIIHYTVRALRDVGVDAHGLVFDTTTVQTFDYLTSVKIRNKRKPWLAALGIYQFMQHLREYLKHGKPDVIHWYFSGSGSTLGADIALLKWLGVPGIVEWVGSDIRIPEVEFADNPYYTAVFNAGYEYQRFESRKDSLRRQKGFADIGFACVTSEGMFQYVQPDIFPTPYLVRKRLILDDFPVHFPDPNNRKPLLVHSPTRQITKGTAAVIKAIESLQEECEFEFKLVTGMPRRQAMQIMASADVFLDQFMLGDWGGSSLEAMAMGKPVVCYLKPAVQKAYPEDLPIVNATQDTLRDVLKGLIENAALRRSLGERGRAYAEKYHDSKKVVYDLLAVYNAVLEQHRRKS